MMDKLGNDREKAVTLLYLSDLETNFTIARGYLMQALQIFETHHQKQDIIYVPTRLDILDIKKEGSVPSKDQNH